MNEQTFDYVIVGAGSAGCVLADHLSADGQQHSARARERRLGSLDADPDALGAFDPDEHAEVQLVLPYGNRNRAWAGAACIRRAAKSLAAPHRSTVLSISVAIRWITNAGWRGAAGWGYADVLPYFRRAERRAEGGDDYRGGNGKLGTCYGSLANPLHGAWLAAAREAGYPHSDDVNGFQQEGFGRMDMTVCGWAALQRGQCLSSPRTAPLQSVADHTRARHPHRIRRQARTRARVSAGRRFAHGQCWQGADPVLRSDQFPAAAQTLRRGPRPGTAGARDPHRS